MATEKLGLDAAYIMFNDSREFINSKSENDPNDTYIDEWGTIYKANKYSWPSFSPIDFPIKSISDLIKFKVPDPNIPGRLHDFKIAKEMTKDKIAIMGSVVGPLTSAFLLAGWYTLSYSLMGDCKIINELFKISTEYYNQDIINMINVGVDVVCIAEDLGYENGTFFSREDYKKYLYPYIQEQIEIIKNKNIPIFFHSCGNVNSVVGDLVEMGINCLHPLQRSAHMNLSEIKQKYGNKISICGNIGSSNTLPLKSKKEVIEETKECIRIGSVGGGFILASDSDLRDDMPVENIIAMFETAKEYGKYI